MSYHFETLQLHVGQEQPDPATGARAVPIYQTTSYVFRDCAQAAARFGLTDAGNIYGRLTNSTQDVLEQRVAALEGGVAALATASGAAAVTYTIQALARQGDHIVAQKTIYGGTYNLLAHTLPQYGITATFVDAHDAAAVEAAIQPNTRAVYLETLGNPNCDIPNIEAIAAVAHRHGLPLVIDNTFGTPYWVKVIPLGADIVVHSATKFLGGHGTTLGGIIVDAGTFDWAASGSYPQLPDHPDHALYQKYFPNGGGSIFTFEIAGGEAEAHRFIDHLQIFSLLANVADVKSLVIHPATTTHSQLTPEELLDQGIRPNTIRLSIGTEHADDLIADLEAGFAAAKG